MLPGCLNICRPAPVNKQLGQSRQHIFVAEPAHDHQRQALAAAYLSQGDGNRPKPLIDPSGHLGKEIASLVTRDAAEIGSSLEYSGVMQGGAKKGAFGKTNMGRPVPWGDIPARVWLGISGEDERNILDIVDDHLAEAIDQP